MSNYTKATDFAAKDNLLTGNPSKLVKGTELGAEFDAIAVAVATKVDSGGALGTPTSGTLTNCTGLPPSTGLSAAVGVAKGGTGVTTIAAKSVFVADALDTVTTVTPGAGQSIRINAGNTAWEAYTPSTGTGDVTGQSSSVDSEIALFSGTGGKTIKRATTTGVLKATSGVIAAASAGTDYAKPDTASSWTAEQTFKEVTDTVYTISDGAAFEIDPGNGSIQVVTLGASRTPAATNFAAGQCVLLGIDDGSTYTITWSTVNPTWVKVGGTASAPTLATSGYTWVMLWKVSSTIYACEVGKP